MTTSKLRKRTHHDIVLSSTFKDLKRHRKAVLDAMTELALFGQAMENDSALPEDLIDSSLGLVRSAKGYVGIIGYRYGQIPKCPVRNPGNLSITELEYEEAEKLGLPICMFVMSSDHKVPLKEAESSSADKKKREAFSRRVADKHIYAEFKSIADLKDKAYRSLIDLRERLDGDEKTLIPTPVTREPQISSAPALFAMPPYAPGHKFTGRARELQLLSDWAVAPNEPILVLEAIGGMGKSMICWEWANNHARKIKPDFAGTFWYSFYERGADMSDFCAYAMAYLSGQAIANLRGQKTAVLAGQLGALLRQKPWLLVLDGLERVLIAYNRYDAAQVRDEEIESSHDPATQKKGTDCIHPADADLLRILTEVSSSKFLVSTRLMPSALLNNSGLERPGVAHKSLTGLDPTDAEAMLHEIGVTGDPARVRHYLEKNFGCHPLVVGVVGGLVRNYPPAPGNFNRWVEDPASGASINLAEMDLVQRRNHILRVAFDDLAPDERLLLTRIALVSEGVDYETLIELNPRRPDPPKIVDPPPEEWRELEFLKDNYQKQKSAHSEYLKEFETWKSSPALPTAEKWLRSALQSLDSRGLLQWDRKNNRYDLHPVVRGFAVGSILPNQREDVAQKVVDYFSARPIQPYEKVTSINDLRSRLEVTRTLLYMGGKIEQAVAITTDIANAMFSRLEAYAEFLALVQPLFPNGWDKPPFGTNGVLMSRLWSNVAIAVGNLGKVSEATSIHENVLVLDIEQDNAISVLADLFNISSSMLDSRCYHAAYLIDDLLASAISVLGDEQYVALSHLWRFSSAVTHGNFAEADQLWKQFDTLPRPSLPNIYRPGEAEAWFCYYLFFQGLLDNLPLQKAERLARENNNRTTLRSLHSLRGEWMLSLQRWGEAIAAYQEFIRMTREVGLDSSAGELRLALAQAGLGRSRLAEESAERLSASGYHLALAELYLALGDQANARQHAIPAYEDVWADGPPYVDWLGLQRCRAVLKALGEAEPQLPAFNPAKAKPFFFEANLRAYLEQKKKEREVKGKKTKTTKTRTSEKKRGL